MVSVLKELWRGNISPIERFVRAESDYKKTASEWDEQIERFLEALTPEEKKQWEGISNLESDMAMLAEEDAFIYGFRLGARLMLDVVGDDRGQFTEGGK